MTKQREDVLERIDRTGRPGAFLIGWQGIANPAEPVRLDLLHGANIHHKAFWCQQLGCKPHIIVGIDHPVLTSMSDAGPDL